MVRHVLGFESCPSDLPLFFYTARDGGWGVDACSVLDMHRCGVGVKTSYVL